ncbi:MAG: carbohydrate ABC transporter permease [Actinomycetota bacterium]
MSTTAPVVRYGSAAEVPARPIPQATKRHRVLRAFIDHTVLIAVAAMFLVPMIFILVTSFMTQEQALTSSLIPQPFNPGNYLDVFREVPLLRYTWNTTQVAVLSTVGTILSCVPVAYALARMQWRGRQFAFVAVLATLMLPFQVTIVPLYIIFVRLGWIGHLTPLILPSFFGDAFSIFLLRQFFMTIPEELSDAARVDGANEWQIMTRVIVPLAKPAIAAVALFNFLYAWNDFFAPLLFVGNNPKLYTLAIGLAEFKQKYQVQWNLTMAASALMMLPIIILFFLAQKVFVEGVTLTGVKG